MKPDHIDDKTWEQLEEASKVVQSWSSWKRGILEISSQSTRSTPRTINGENE